MSFINALTFLTVFPVPRHYQAESGGVGKATAFFPLVGLGIGGILSGLGLLLSLFLPLPLVGGLLLMTLVLLTGALHIDGLADTCDGIAGHVNVEERLRIMDDSHTGAFGVAGVVLVLLLKYAALGSLSVNLLPAALLIMPVLGRWAMVYAIYAFPYAKPVGLGLAFKRATTWRELSIATVTALAVALVAAYLSGLPRFYLVGPVVMLVVWVVTLVIALYLKKKLSGLTGDTYGAINEVAEVTVLILASLAAYAGGFSA